MTSAPPELPIRDAATIIALRQGPTGAEVLMGRRHVNSAFMPNVYVFPGGAVDRGDNLVPLARSLPEACSARLGSQGPALAVAAIRELWEETGLRLSIPGPWPAPPPDWASFAAGGHRPDAGDLRFIFRAITPKGRPRRFDARFCVVDGAAFADLQSATDSNAELSDLRWVPVAETASLGLMPVTAVALIRAQEVWRSGESPADVPFFDGRDEGDNIARFRARMLGDA